MYLPETPTATVTAKTKPIALNAIGIMTLPVQVELSAKSRDVGAKHLNQLGS